MRVFFFFGLLSVAVLMCACAAPSQPTNASDDAAIRAVLTQWSTDFNNKNVPAECGLFAPDLILSYPGTPDRNYDGTCQGFTTQLARTDLTFRYDAPEIQAVSVSGNLAAVRLIRTSRISGAGLNGEIVEREQGLDVLKKQPDGSWKIFVSHAYPME